MAAEQKTTLGWMDQSVGNMEEKVADLSDDPPTDATEYALAVTELNKLVREYKALVIAEVPDTWHKSVKTSASAVEARATVVYEEVDKVKTVFKEAKRVNSQIEDAIEAFGILKEKVADEDSNEQRKLYHQRLLRIIEDAGVVSGATRDY